MENNFKIKIEMLSDFQIGTGTGIPGGTDKLISKDVDGFPNIPAKTVVGIWRDSLELLCEGLGKDWLKWVEIIFGNQPNEKGADPTKKPVVAIFSTQPARIEENLRAKIGTDTRLKQALTFTKVGVNIDEISGTSSTDMLRFEELGRSGTVFGADVELDFEKLVFSESEKENQLKTIKSLLLLSSFLIERIGGKRRRGAGKCNVFVENLIEKSEALEHLKTYRDIFPTPAKPHEDKRDNEIEVKPTFEDWKTCVYTLTTETPVSIVSAVLGNVSETLDYIPGTYLISYFVKHLGSQVFEHVQNNNLQILPATISIDGKRGMPIPKAFAKEKMRQKDKAKEEVYNRLLEPLEDKEQTKPIREGYISDINSTCLSLANTPISILMHNAVDDDFQRPTSDVVGVYSRKAIKAGTILKGEIRYRGFEFDFTKLGKNVRIGTSKKDDYGLAKIEFSASSKQLITEHKIDKELFVYLASDVMLRNNKLRQTNLAEDLAKAIGLDENAEVMYQQIQVRRIESWQVGWGFPRPSLCLMQAGSVVRFKIDKEVDVAKLESEGIGERRGEGYGQIIFNPKILEINKPNWDKGNLDKIGLPKAVGEIKDTEFAKLIEKTAWLEELKIAVSKIAVEDVKKKDINEQVFGFKGLTMSQIGGLRSVIMRLKTKPDKSLIDTWITHLKGNKNRYEIWGKTRIEKVEKILINDEIWTALGTSFNKPTALNLDHNLQDELWAEAVKSLFYACQHAHKRELEKGGQNNGSKN